MDFAVNDVYLVGFYQISHKDSENGTVSSTFQDLDFDVSL